LKIIIAVSKTERILKIGLQLMTLLKQVHRHVFKHSMSLIRNNNAKDLIGN